MKKFTFTYETQIKAEAAAQLLASRGKAVTIFKDDVLSLWVVEFLYDCTANINTDMIDRVLG